MLLTCCNAVVGAHAYSRRPRCWLATQSRGRALAEPRSFAANHGVHQSPPQPCSYIVRVQDVRRNQSHYDAPLPVVTVVLQKAEHPRHRGREKKAWLLRGLVLHACVLPSTCSNDSQEPQTARNSERSRFPNPSETLADFRMKTACESRGSRSRQELQPCCKHRRRLQVAVELNLDAALQACDLLLRSSQRGFHFHAGANCQM